jgi:CheY-like chemotaxis protein
MKDRGQLSGYTQAMAVDDKPDGAIALAAPIQSPIHPLDFHAPKILIVDDEDINRRVLSLYLEGFNCTSVEAANGDDALGILNGTHVDCVISDVNLPGISGLEVTRKIRAHGNHSVRTIPVIGISGQVSDVDHHNAACSGMDRYLDKPINRRLLLIALQELLPGRVVERKFVR